jgi:hypothetical protein
LLKPQESGQQLVPRPTQAARAFLISSPRYTAPKRVRLTILAIRPLVLTILAAISNRIEQGETFPALFICSFHSFGSFASPVSV